MIFFPAFVVLLNYPLDFDLDLEDTQMGEFAVKGEGVLVNNSRCMRLKNVGRRKIVK